LCLNWRRSVVTGLLNGFQNGCGEPKCVKSHTRAVLNGASAGVKVRLQCDLVGDFQEAG
jgi:hypothetical protein